MSKNKILVKDYNPNQKCKDPKVSGDSMVRAICKVTWLEWEEIYTRLCERGLKMGMMPNCTDVVEKEFNDFKFKRNIFKTKMHKFVEKHQKGIYILISNDYAFVLYDGIIFDADADSFLKDMKRAKIDSYFIIKEW